MNELLINKIKEQVEKEQIVRITCGDESLCQELKDQIFPDLYYFNYDIYQNCNSNWILEIQDNQLESNNDRDSFMSKLIKKVLRKK